MNEINFWKILEILECKRVIEAPLNLNQLNKQPVASTINLQIPEAHMHRFIVNIYPMHKSKPILSSPKCRWCFI